MNKIIISFKKLVKKIFFKDKKNNFQFEKRELDFEKDLENKERIKIDYWTLYLLKEDYKNWKLNKKDKEMVEYLLSLDNEKI